MSVPESKVVWITGAAGGLGSALTTAFLARGWRVVASGHSTTPEVDDPRCWATRTDVTRGEDVRATVSGLVSRWGRLDAVILNAGVLADALVPQMTDEAWDKVLDVHLKGAFLCCRESLGPMLKAGRGHIVSVASIAACEGVRGQSNYAAAKAGLIGLTLSLAREVGPSGICVNAVLPGMLATPMLAGLSAEQVRSQTERSVLGQLNEVHEPAHFIAELAALHHVSGQVFALDGRITRWV